MPMDRKRYPHNWDEISLSVRNKASWCCEWCGVPNAQMGFRDQNGNWVSADQFAEERGHDDHSNIKWMRIVLTVAHLGTAHEDGTPGNKDDKMDVRPENLAALCQRCHLNYDRLDNLAKRKAKRSASRLSIQPMLL